MAAQKPLEVEIVAYVTGSMQHCSHCQVFIDGVGVGEKIHNENVSSYPPDLVQEWQALSDWILEVARTYPGRLVIRVTDAQSPQGLWKALTKGVRKYPTFILDGQETYHGWDKDRLDALIQKHL